MKPEVLVINLNPEDSNTGNTVYTDPSLGQILILAQNRGYNK